MAAPFSIPVSTSGLLAAIACVIAGGPLFAFGLRVLRVRRALAHLRTESLSQNLRGLVQVSGTVALESPLFAPLTQTPCAGFTLEVAAVSGPGMRGAIRDLRAFRLESDGGSARIEATRGEWRLPVTAERTLAPGESASERLEQYLAGDAEARWLRASGQRLRLVERALVQGGVAHVVGVARACEAETLLGESEVMARTGTDDAPMSVVASAAAGAHALDVVIGDDDPLAPLLVQGADVAPAHTIAPPAWQQAGVVLGPAISLAGLLYLAHAAERLLAAGGLS